MMPTCSSMSATSARVEAYGELGIAAALLSDRALDLARAESGTTVELGVRAAAGYRFASGAQRLYFAAQQVIGNPPDIGSTAASQSTFAVTFS